MPQVSKRRRANIENWKKRSVDKTPDNINDGTVDVNNNELTYSDILEENYSTNSIAIQKVVELRTNGTQTNDSMDLYNYKRKTALNESITWEVISIILDLFRNYNPYWNAVHERVLSVIFYMLFRILGFSFKEAETFLKALNCNSAKIAHEWSESLILNKDDPTCLFEDKRGNVLRCLFRTKFK